MLEALLVKIGLSECKSQEDLETFVASRVLTNQTLQQTFQVSDEEIEALYKEGYEHYQIDSFERSCQIFRWLVTFNPFVKRFWMGFGASLQLLSKPEKALEAYAVAAFLDPNDPLPHFHAHECYLDLGNEDEAKKALSDYDRRAHQGGALCHP